MTNQDYAAIHYIPANHVFARYTISGAEGARQQVGEEAARMREENKNDPVMARWLDWYERTALALITELENGGQVHQNYPAFIP